MAAQKGADLLMKIGDGGSPESFTTIGGMRSTSLSMNDEMVDITNNCLLYTSPSPRDRIRSRMPSSA